MHRRTWLTNRFAALLATGLVVVLLRPSAAAEPAQEFLDGLRQRGMYETALLYLERSQTNPITPADFRTRIEFEQGRTLLEQARATADPDIRDRLLGEARAKLEQFLSGNPEEATAAAARGQLANILVYRATAEVGRAERMPQGSERNEVLAGARKLFDDARAVFDQTAEFYRQALTGLPQDPDPQEDRDLYDRRRSYRGELVQAQLLSGTVLFEQAGTYGEGDPKRTELFTSAAERMGKLYENYRRWAPGLYARLYEGRCYQQLGDLEKAIGCFEDLVALPSDQPSLRELIAKATRYQAESMIAQEQPDEAIARSQRWLDDATATELGHPEWAAVAFQLARAHEQKAESLAPGDPQRRTHLNEARARARDAAKVAGEVRPAAQQMVARLSGQVQQSEPKTFDEALAAGRDAADLMQSSTLAVRLARENNPEQVDELQQQIVTSRQAALQYLSLALRLASHETPPAELNQARYQLALINWESERYYDAAVLGDFLARRDSDGAYGRRAARVALASYQMLYDRTEPPQRQFAADGLIDMARWTAATWPKGPEADEARLMLVSFALQQDNLDEALEYVQQLPPGQRAAAEAKIGLALWGKFLRGSRMEEPERPSQAELNALQVDARTRLQQAVASLGENAEVDSTLATAALSLAQVHLENAEFERAIAALEDENTGALPLVAANHPAASGDEFIEEAHKAALRAYISVRPPRLEQAEKVMDALEARTQGSGDAAADEKLTRIYLALGKQLQQQIRQLKDEGRQEDVSRLSEAFEVFLARIGGRENGDNWSTRNWIAQMYYSLAAGMDDGQGPLDAQVKSYYEKSAATFQSLLVAPPAGDPPSEQSLLGVRFRLAECYRALRDYKQALDMFGRILDEKPTLLEVQIAAATTYGQRGEAENPGWYKYAILGGRKDRKTQTNRIWGWHKLSQIAHRSAANRPELDEIFYQARYNVADCQFHWGMKLAEQERTEQLDAAKQSIRNMRQLFPELGGQAWYDKYEALLKRIQKARGDTAIGFEEFTSESIQRVSSRP